MPVFPDSPECAALRADMRGDRLNSRFWHIHKHKSVKKNRLSSKIDIILAII